MIFEEPSTRTRVSFEVAMTQLGGHALYLKPGELHLGQRESVGDTARVLSRMVDGILARTISHATLLELAQVSAVPVINGLTDYNHPTQAVCDVVTMIENLPAGRPPEDIHITFVGDATNVLNSLMLLCTRLGMHFTHSAPLRYQPTAKWQELARANCLESGGTLAIVDDPRDAVHDADFIYTDLWWWVGQEAEIVERREAFLPDYQVSMELLRAAPAGCKFMHCLPASRGLEVTDEVLDSARSIAFDQAENRLHAERGLLAWLLHPSFKPGPPAEAEAFEAEAREIFERLV
jgi:putrescine carbamoyltransferase